VRNAIVPQLMNSISLLLAFTWRRPTKMHFIAREYRYQELRGCYLAEATANVSDRAEEK